MTEQFELVAAIRADVKGLHKGFRETSNALESTKARFNKFAADTSREMKKVERTVKGVENVMKGFAGLIVATFATGAAARAVGDFVNTADKFNILTARIREMTRETGDFNKVYQQLSKISAETGTDLETSVQVFQRLTLARKDLGATNDQMLELTRTVEQLGIISGASGEEMKNGLRQFAQAMSSGIVRAEEMNSILENIPAVATKVADSLGVSAGQLRKMVVDGEITSREFFDALISKSEEVQEEFDRMPVSVERANNRMGLALQKLVGEMDASAGATQNLAKVINDLAGVVEENTPAMVHAWSEFVNRVELGAVSLGIGFERIAIKFRLLVNEFQTSVAKANLAASDMGAFWVKRPRAGDLVQMGLERLSLVGRDRELFNNMSGAMADINERRLGLFSGGGAGGGLGGGLLDDEDGSGKKGKKGKSLQDRMTKLTSSVQKLVKEGMKPYHESIKAITDEWDNLEVKLTPLQEAGISIFEQTRTAAENYKYELQALNELTAAGAVDQESYNRRLAQLKDEYFPELKTEFDQMIERVGTLESAYQSGALSLAEFSQGLIAAQSNLRSTNEQQSNDLKALAAIGQEWGRAMENSITRFVETGKFGFREFVNSALSDLARLMTQLSVINPLINAATGSSLPTWGKVLGSLAGGLFGGGGGFLGGAGSTVGNLSLFASGGIPPANKPSIVGEQGPELFLPGQTGRVFSNPETMAPLGGGRGTEIHVHQTINVQTGVQETVRAEIQALRPQFRKDAVAAVNEAIQKGGATARLVGARN